MRRANAKHWRAARQQAIADQQGACEPCSHAFRAKRSTQKPGGKRSFPPDTDKPRPLGRKGRGSRSPWRGVSSVERYFFVHFSTFQVGPWLVGLSTRPPSVVL